MIDINHIINMEILKARMNGMNDLATELLEISSKGTSVPEWVESREKAIERLYMVQDEYRKFFAGFEQRRILKGSDLIDFEVFWKFISGRKVLDSMKYIASCSFGKDSIATILLAREHNEPLDEIVYCEVMFDKNISGELPEHRDFIYNKAIPTFESWGYKIVVLHSKNTYVDLFYRMVSKSGAESRNGKFRGFPMSMGCHMNSGAKIPPIRNYWKSYNEDVTQYVGIAIDEPKRLDRMADTENKISLLEKYGYTEEMAKQKCLEYGLLSPIYEFTSRGGCWFCPNARDSELRHLRDNHKDLWNKLIELSKEDTANPYFNCFRKTTIQGLEEQFMWEDRQMNIFDCIKESEVV